MVRALWTVLAVLSFLPGCRQIDHTAVQRHYVAATTNDYESARRYWRDPGFPQLVMLMDRHSPQKVVLARIQREWPQHGGSVDLTTIDEADFPVVIKYHTDVFGMPTVTEIHKHSSTPDGSRLAKVGHLNKWGDLEREETLINGKAHGIQRRWYPYPHNRLEWSSEYTQGDPDGYWRYYAKDGSMLQEEMWEQGTLISCWEMHAGKWQQTVTNGSGRCTIFWNGEAGGFEEYEAGRYVRGAH